MSVTAPIEWRLAEKSIESAAIPPDVRLTEIPAPRNLAPFSKAFAADMTPGLTAHGSDGGTGRFVLLYDPEGNDAWQGTMRVVCFASAPLEADLGLDPFLADVAWSWLIDALLDTQAEYLHVSGTATKTINTGFGELATGSEGTEMEVRASWSPQGANMAAHVEAWLMFLRQLAGTPPLPDGISPIEGHRRAVHQGHRGE